MKSYVFIARSTRDGLRRSSGCLDHHITT